MNNIKYVYVFSGSSGLIIASHRNFETIEDVNFQHKNEVTNV